MSYELEFHIEALKEWRKLNKSVQTQFNKKLTKVLDNPEIPANRLRGVQNRYKVKLRDAGFRLVYEVQGERLIVVVIAVGKREKLAVYRAQEER